MLPDDICSLGRLEGLVLAKNRISRLPENIGGMNLKVLSLYSNNLSELPESFFDLKLEKLNLAGNRLADKDRDRVLEAFGQIGFIRV